ncbi:MAG: hypothetical protein P8H24_01345 [Methylophilaceae bacterium]|nr:hypothetical protein [Methylophilaceae bacterium]
MNKSKRDKQKNKGNKRKISSEIAAATAAFLLVSGNAWAGTTLGGSAAASGIGETAIGYQSTAIGGNCSTAIGAYAKDTTCGVAIGSSATAITGSFATALGTVSEASGG